MHFQSVTFDLDGTLLDTVPDLHEAARRMLAELGLPPRREDEIRNFVGQGDYDVVLVATGTFERLARTSGSWRVDLRPGNAFADSSAWAHRLSAW